MPNMLGTIIKHIMQQELFSNLTLSKYFTPLPLMCKYVAQIINFSFILSLFFVLSQIKLKETKQRNWFYSASMDEQLEYSALTDKYRVLFYCLPFFKLKIKFCFFIFLFFRRSTARQWMNNLRGRAITDKHRLCFVVYRFFFEIKIQFCFLIPLFFSTKQELEHSKAKLFLMYWLHFQIFI